MAKYKFGLGKRLVDKVYTKAEELGGERSNFAEFMAKTGLFAATAVTSLVGIAAGGLLTMVGVSMIIRPTLFTILIGATASAAGLTMIGESGHAFGYNFQRSGLVDSVKGLFNKVSKGVDKVTMSRAGYAEKYQSSLDGQSAKKDFDKAVDGHDTDGVTTSNTVKNTRKLDR